MRISLGALLVFTASFPADSLAGPQRGDEPQRKPVLVRPEPAEDTTDAPVPYDPVRAEKEVEIGDFYFRRDNYKAAEARYREAIRYNPRLVSAYEKLIRSLEKLKEPREAIEVCRQFVNENPDSDQARRFEEWARKLEDGGGK